MENKSVPTVFEIKRIDLWSLFKVAFFVFALIGLVGGFFYLFVMTVFTGIGGILMEEDLPGFGLIGGVIGFILVPVLAFLYGAMGSIAAVIFGLIMNLVMKMGGGVKFDADVHAPIRKEF